MINYKVVILSMVFALFMSVTLYGQKERTFVRKGNKNMERKDYKEAEIQYRKALEESPLCNEGEFNLGNSLYLQNNYEEAMTSYAAVAKRSDDVKTKSSALYNLGNTLYDGQKYAEAAEAYKQTLRLDPNNENARYNLAMAQQKLQESEQQEQQNQDGENQNSDNQDQQQQQQNQQQEGEENQEKQQSESQEQQQQQAQQGEEGQGEDQQAISKEDAERMLDALENEEQKTIEKIQKDKTKGQNVKIDKDW
ncbi:MAG: tetratricopeptide repeat protein [Bacteroidales bacterium]|jgi:Ca-activated chloride channel homolog|nr:tetratricopeptide repeat protein [Bacteroidales bacterium]MDD2203868.1 tetratricopeptide repeat protein [Bacteroidales bacterium]MDD3151375.1 tetratricopeptide repeat protein [Bacteroidales bacterium]MDD3913116.1 tetratricopeptide repeat protein [Bacteroidales bacterium]MDD4633031.1 tetratricopeptide repeat protein [Bacteroidales bacterium]